MSRERSSARGRSSVKKRTRRETKPRKRYKRFRDCPDEKCRGELTFKPNVVGMTCGGLWLRGWSECSKCHHYFLSGRGKVCDAPTWSLSKGGQSVEIGTGRLRAKVYVSSLDHLDVRGLMSRIVRLPDLERAELARSESPSLEAAARAYRNATIRFIAQLPPQHPRMVEAEKAYDNAAAELDGALQQIADTRRRRPHG